MFDLIKKFFAPKPRKGCRIFVNRNRWGNRLEINKNGNCITCICTPSPIKGDLIQGGNVFWLVTNCRNAGDPPDLAFADVVKYEGEIPPSEIAN
jgi:hypothetical protein